MYLRPFDPWKNEFCTCPPKLSLNPYTGCSHGCLYCYASSYIKNFHLCREKPNLLQALKREIVKTPPNSLISISNTSDPYPPIEQKKGIMRECLKILKKHGMRVLIITKSNLIIRDIDILVDMATAVTMTITTLKHYRKIEPKAPSPFERLKALELLSKRGIKTGLRFDPIIPLINEDELETVLNEAKSVGVSHVISSTFKPRWDSWRRIISAFPEFRSSFEELYIKSGERVGVTRYLAKNYRLRLMLNIQELCESLKLTFSTCRENLKECYNRISCDGSHLIESNTVRRAGG